MTGSGTRARRSTNACWRTRRVTTTRSMNAWCGYDVRASIAHAEMLQCAEAAGRRGPCSPSATGSTAIGAEHAAGQWKIELADEDGQTALEKRLTARIGAAGGRVHLGRSRNDQVLTALRLYLLDAGAELAARRGALRRGARCAGAARRRHRPAGLHPHAAGHAEQRGAVGRRFRRRTARRCRRACAATARRASKSPLGSAAGYGTPGLPLDRERHAREARLRERARAGHRRAAGARQGRSAVAVRDARC